jgi:predicted short-subunit dehydrogenase-like oxidoreductase (DUF2520 family)
MKVVVIGSGNVAYYLASLLAQSKHTLLQIAGRNKKTVSLLARKLKCSFTIDIKTVDQTADIFIIAVNDDSIIDVAKQLPETDKIVLHTSGSTSLDVLSKFKNAGVLYPIQSLNKQSAALEKNITFCIEASNLKTEKTLSQLGKSIGNKIVKLNSNKRLKLHLAAVVVNNFVNHLYVLSHDFLDKSKIDFSLLLPLIERTGKKVVVAHPQKVQTGPAMRNDQHTIKKHIALLQDDPVLKKFYSQFSRDIHQYHKNKN